MKRLSLNTETLPAQADIHIWRGDYVEIPLEFYDADSEMATDIGNYTGKADIVLNGNVVASFDVDISSTVGHAILRLESPASAQLIPGVYNYDFQLVQFYTNRVRTYLYGWVIVTGEVTVGV